MIMSVAAVFSSIFLLSLSLISSSQPPNFDDVVLQQALNGLSLPDLVSNRAASDQIIVQSETSFSVEDKTLGQIAGLAVSPDNELLLFCRRERLWEFDSFDFGNRFTGRDKGFITNDTVIVLDPSSGKIIRSFGGKRFYMPHGITVDPDGNVWVTDVALHQVMRFSRSDTSAPDLVIGEAFVPGNDQFHFCKPTDIAISSTGVAYISDGYCNSRVVIVSPEGKVIGSIANGDFEVAHSVMLVEKEDMVCVADREGRRVACYTAGLRGSQAGKLLLDLRHPELKRVYAIDYLGDILFAVNGPEAESERPNVVAIDLPTERMVAKFAPTDGFFEPHDVAVAADGNSIFVSDIDKRSKNKVVEFRLS